MLDAKVQARRRGLLYLIGFIKIKFRRMYI